MMRRAVELSSAIVLLFIATSAQAGIVDPYEPDNDSANATPLVVGVPQADHSLDPPTDEDWYSFTVAAPTTVTALTDGAAGDTKMELYTSDGALLDSDDNSANGDFSQIVLRLPVGSYFLRVFEAGMDATVGQYTIAFGTANRPGDAFEPDDTWLEPTTLIPVTPQQHTLSNNRGVSDIVDWYTFTVPIDGNVEVRVTDAAPVIDPGTGLATDTFTPSFVVYDDSLTEVAASTAATRAGDNAAESILRRELMNGTYLIRVALQDFSLPDAINSTYDISLRVPEIVGDKYEPDNDATEATPIAVGEQQPFHTLNPYGDEDWVSFTLAETRTIVLHASDQILEDANGPAIQIELFADNLSLIDSGSSVTETLAAGSYFARYYVDAPGNLALNYSAILADGAEPDAYEVDDTPELASYLTGGDIEQVHNFHTSSDVDWIRFYGSDGYFLVVDTAFLAGGMPEVAVFAGDAMTELLADEQGVRTLPADGFHFVRVTRPGGVAVGPDSLYVISLRIYDLFSNFEDVGVLPASAAGVVRDDNDVPVQGAEVSVTELAGVRTETDADGVYLFNIGPGGSFTLRASRSGYADDSGLVALVGGQIVARDFVLATMPELSVTPASREVGIMSGTTSFTVSNIGTGTFDWTAEVISGGDWLTITGGDSGTDSGAVQLSFAENTGVAERLGTVRVTATDSGGAVAGSPVDVSVTQAGAPAETPLLHVSEQQVALPGEGGSVQVFVSNLAGGTLEWNAEVLSGAEEWLSIETAKVTGPGVITVSAAANMSGAVREGSVRVTAPGADGSPITFHVEQAATNGPVLKVTPTSVSIGAAGGTRSVQIANTGGGVLNWSVVELTGENWISVDNTSGTGDAVIEVFAAPHSGSQSRMGAISIADPNAANSTVVVNVVQSGADAPSLEVSPLELFFGTTGGTREVAVDVDGSGWEASLLVEAPWLSISPAAGDDDGAITVMAAPNNTGAPRYVDLRVSASEPGAPSYDVKITQTASTAVPVLLLSATQVDVTAAPGEAFIAVSNGGGGVLDWSAAVTAGQDWLSVTPAKGLDGFTVAFDANEGSQGRNGFVRVDGPGALGAPAFVVVSQEGAASLSVTPTQIIIGAAGGQRAINVSNTASGDLVWSVSVQAGTEWLFAPTGETTGNSDATITISANGTGATRQGLLQVNAPGALNSPQAVAVIQTAFNVPGDVNGDGTVNAVDVQLVINAALGVDEVPAADQNGDGEVNAVDIQFVINAALGV